MSNDDVSESSHSPMSNDDVSEAISFSYVPGIALRVSRLGGKCFYALDHLGNLGQTS